MLEELHLVLREGLKQLNQFSDEELRHGSLHNLKVLRVSVTGSGMLKASRPVITSIIQHCPNLSYVHWENTWCDQESVTPFQERVKLTQKALGRHIEQSKSDESKSRPKFELWVDDEGFFAGR
ncbi:hypothetical protein PINS_up023945 [Pythium insidiosum]|nr:hypothetical protein PINS_up023945 [Pythium insidiosum]